jgi:hypothetical protein
MNKVDISQEAIYAHFERMVGPLQQPSKGSVNADTMEIITALRAHLTEVKTDLREEISLCENLSLRLEDTEAEITRLTAALSEMQMDRDSKEAMVNIAYNAGYYQAECGLPEHPNAIAAAKELTARAERAEAALAKAFRDSLDAVATEAAMEEAYEIICDAYDAMEENFGDETYQMLKYAATEIRALRSQKVASNENE